MKKIAILSTGTWGTALGKVLCEAGHEVKAWSPFKSEIEEIERTHTHRNLPGVKLPEGITFTTDIGLAIKGADYVIVASPSPFVRNTVNEAKPYITDDMIVACVAKGLEPDTLFTMSEIIEDVLGNNIRPVALSGPTHAEEVAVNIPTLIVSASEDMDHAASVQSLFAGTCIRPYTNSDIKGVELCGALKNVIALACGISDGIGYGDNTKAAIITRGIAEIKRLGAAMGLGDTSFTGLAGIGDLIVTATSRHSRNNRAGHLIGEGYSTKNAVEKVGMVVEGINALPGALSLASKYDVELPIISAVDRIVNEGIPPKQAVDELLGRRMKSE